jgi:glucoamylase
MNDCLQDAGTFQPCSDKALSSLKVYVDSFRSIYTLNSGIAANAAVATGRYPEDVYMGGNPWYLTTAAVAEQLYDALSVWAAQGSLDVTAVSLPFFQQFQAGVTAGTYASSTETFTTLTAAIKSFADGFLEIHAKYTVRGWLVHFKL